MWFKELIKQVYLEEAKADCENAELQRKLVTARIYTMRSFPFWGTIFDNLNYVCSPDLNPPTMAVDSNGNLYYHPRFAEKYSIPELAGVFAHEAFHVVSHHLDRLTDKNPVVWNIATDFYINYFLRLDGMQLPDCVLASTGDKGLIKIPLLPGLGFDPSKLNKTNSVEFELEDKSADWLYREIMNVWQNLPNGPRGDPGGPGGQGQPGEQDQGGAPKQPGTEKTKKGAGGTGKKPTKETFKDALDELNKQRHDQHLPPGSEKKPGGTGGKPGKPGEPGEPGKPGKPGGLGGPGIGPNGELNEPAEPRKDWKQIVSDAVHIAKKSGKVGPQLGKLIDDLNKPQVNWKAVLAKYIKQSSGGHYVRKLPSKRTMAIGKQIKTALPRYVLNKMLDTIIAVDVSGSITNAEIKQFLTEIYDILQTVPQIKAKLILWDTKIKSVLDLTTSNKNDVLKTDFGSGGGTAINSVTIYLDQEKITPKLIIYLTDGHVYDSPIRLPSCPKVFAIAMPQGTEEKLQKYGVTVPVEIIVPTQQQEGI